MEDGFPIPEDWTFEVSSKKKVIIPSDDLITTIFDGGENVYVKASNYAFCSAPVVLETWQVTDNKYLALLRYMMKKTMNAFTTFAPISGSIMYLAAVIETSLRERIDDIETVK